MNNLAKQVLAKVEKTKKKQIRSVLNADNCFCILGLMASYVPGVKFDDGAIHYKDQIDDCGLPSLLVKDLGMRSGEGKIKHKRAFIEALREKGYDFTPSGDDESERNLMGFNDTCGATFEQLAYAMKKVPKAVFATLALMFGLLTASAQTNAVTVAWDANPETDIAGYHVKYGIDDAGGITNDVFVSGVNNTTNQIVNLAPGTKYFFFVTAENTHGLQSDPSTILFYDTPSKPSVVQGMRIEFNLLSANGIQGPFTNEMEFRVTYEIPQKFYLAEVSNITLTNMADQPPLPE